MSESVELVNGKYKAEKDPDAVLDYTWDFAAWLDAISDTIASVDFIESTVNPVTVVSSSNTTTQATAFVGGGSLAAEEDAFVTCRITTAGGRIQDRTLYLKIKSF